MKLPGAAFLRDRSAVRAFEQLDPTFRTIVIYSEGPGDWPHLGPVVRELLDNHDVPLSYLTSDPADPGLAIEDPRFRAFNIGSGTARTVLFARMECRHFVMTLPDLGNLWLKRSVHPVHYVYLFHSMNSTHTSYRTGAFDNFDTVLCVGPHHVNEIRATESEYGLVPKELVEHGSAKLDTLLAEVGGATGASDQGPVHVLVAPTWGDSSFIERDGGPDAIRSLLGAGYRITLRLHPMTVRRLPRLRDRFASTFGSAPLFTLEESMSATQSWLRSDVMVSDWSGAATEYAFALGKPVVYIDTPPKIMNPDWRRIGLTSFEDAVRQLIGSVVATDELAELSAVVDAAARGSTADQRAFDARDRLVFNVRESSPTAAAYLASL